MRPRHRSQSSWAQDEDKLTFILLERGQPDTPGTGAHGGAMAGDVNLFFTLDEEEGGRQVRRGRGLHSARSPPASCGAATC